MRRLLSFFGVFCVLLAFSAAAPQAVQAEGDPPPTPQPILPPWITGQNPQVSLSEASPSEVEASGVVASSQVSNDSYLANPPGYVALAPQASDAPAPALNELAVPQRFQDPDDPTCGAAALGMALEFLSLSQGGEAPTTESLIGDLENSGFLYETGTGVEELAYLARSYGYRGASPFQGWTLEKLAGELAAGRPAVVSLGLNGADQAGHFVTLTGMAANASWVRYNDPVLGERTVSAEDFMASWALQGNSGLTVQKGALAAASDPLLTWMGLLGAISVLTVLTRAYPLGSELKDLLGNVQSILGSPTRKGLGGKLEASAGGGGGGSAPPYSAPAGYHWVKTTVPQYGWKETQVTKTRQVPILVEQQVRVGTRVWYEQVPRYRTVWVDKGSWAWRKVTKYKREKYIRYYKTTSEKKTRWVRKNGRFVQETYYVTTRVPVYGYHDVPYTAWEKYWMPKWVSEQVLDGYTQVRHEEPIYETRMVASGQYRTEYYTETVKIYGQVGTTVKWELEKNVDNSPQEVNTNQKQETCAVEGDPVLEDVPNFFQDPLGWMQNSLINLGRTNDTVHTILESTLVPAADWLQSIPDEEEQPVLSWVNNQATNLVDSADEMVTSGIEGWIKAYESAKIIADYTIDAVKDGRWDDVVNVAEELSRVPEELTDALLDEYDDLPFLAQLGIGIAPGGDIVDVVKETRNATKGEPVDGFVLGLSLVGLLMDLGWADGIVPDPADGGNAAASFLKALLKQVPDGPARDALEQLLKNPDEYGKIVEAIQELSKNSDLLTKIEKPAIFVKLIESGSEGIALLAKNGDEGIKLINIYGSEMADFLIRHSDEAGTAAQNAMELIEAGDKLTKASPGSSEARKLIEQITDLATHGGGDRVVLGRWVEDGGGYIGEAVENGGIYFETPRAFWEAIGGDADLAWEANQKFLENQLESGIDIYFDGDIDAVLDFASDSTAANEINFIKDNLQKYGYQFSESFNGWIKISQ